MPPPAERTLVIGEALIDVVRRVQGGSAEHVGGSPANVALGLARLGHAVDFATEIGDDDRGRSIARRLGDNGVVLTADSVTDRPTSVAMATLDHTGAASYEFAISWEAPSGLPEQGVGHVHTGSIAAAMEPGATAVLDHFREARSRSTLSYDPNARPTLMDDAARGRARAEEFVAQSDVVKASDEDVDWLYDGASVPEVLRRWGALGATLTVVTRGGAGAVVGLHSAGSVFAMEAPDVDVVDTVGAGDSFMAGLISGLLDAGLLGGVEARARLASATMGDVTPAVARALACAGVTVSRAGADPPRREDLRDGGDGR